MRPTLSQFLQGIFLNLIQTVYTPALKSLVESAYSPLSRIRESTLPEHCGGCSGHFGYIY